MRSPHNCTDCPICRSCNAAMYTEGCEWFPPHMEAKEIGQKIKNFFSKIFN